MLGRKKRGAVGFQSFLRRAIFLVVASFVTQLFRLEKDIGSERQDSGIFDESTLNTFFWLSPGKYALWTYAIKPTASIEIHDDEVILCAYESCRNFALATKRPFRSFNLAEVLSLANGLSIEQATKFQHFLEDQHWYKIHQNHAFSHHVQSVSFLSLIAIERTRHRNCCIRPLGYNTSFCGKDIYPRSAYDPTSDDPSRNVPPYRIDGLDFNKTRFGVLSYNQRVALTEVGNSGDELQTFPGLQFLPYVTDLVDRDFGLPDSRAEHLFANAWWSYPSLFPPPSNMTAVFFSVHFSGEFKSSVVSQNMKYFLQYVSQVGPIGARDSPTQTFLDSLKLPTYQSSCFTQMLRPNGNKFNQTKHNRELIMLVDVEPDLLPSAVVKRCQVFKAEVDISEKFQHYGRVNHAQRLFSLYSNEAKVVITSRIHSALPASVNGVPVIFVERSDKNLPGGEGGRTQGISDLFHIYRPEDGDEWSFDLDNMPPNPGVHRQDRYRASFWNYIRQRLPSWYVDTANLFGLVPLTRLGREVPHGEEELHQIFHFIFATPADTITWRLQRAIEAVFFHHPNAKVIFHSNTVPVKGSRLDRFVEVGYEFQVRPYCLETLLRQSMTVSASDCRKLLNIIDSHKKKAFWYAHEVDLIRLLILEKHGGVFLDIFVHVLKPFPKFLRNVMVYQDCINPNCFAKLGTMQKVDTNVMIFERGNRFLLMLVTQAMDCLLHKYDPSAFGLFGPDLLSAAWQMQGKKESHELNVRVMDSTAFYAYSDDAVHKCFQNSNLDHPINQDAFALHVYFNEIAKLESTSEGSHCNKIFHSHCIFCDEIYTMPSNVTRHVDF